MITIKQLCLSLSVYLAWLNVIRKGDKSNEINLNHKLLAFGERVKPENWGKNSQRRVEYKQLNSRMMSSPESNPGYMRELCLDKIRLPTMQQDNQHNNLSLDHCSFDQLKSHITLWELVEPICHFHPRTWFQLRMSRITAAKQLFVGSYLQLFWWTLGK